MREALEKSCNVYFYTLGNLLGVDRIHKWATALGLGEMSGVDLPHETQGIMPSTAWKKQRTGEKWYAGETISVAIGQGQVSVTPISLAVMMASVANGGTRDRAAPGAGDRQRQGLGATPAAGRPEGPATSPASTSTSSVRGCGWWSTAPAPAAAAGSSATTSAARPAPPRSSPTRARPAPRGDRDLRDHGWFVFFAPAKNPTIAGVVFAEHAEHGYFAAPIAKYMMETWFAKQEGRPLPTLAPLPGAPVPAPRRCRPRSSRRSASRRRRRSPAPRRAVPADATAASRSEAP